MYKKSTYSYASSVHCSSSSLVNDIVRTNVKRAFASLVTGGGCCSSERGTETAFMRDSLTVSWESAIDE